MEQNDFRFVSSVINEWEKIIGTPGIHTSAVSRLNLHEATIRGRFSSDGNGTRHHHPAGIFFSFFFLSFFLTVVF
jgi:hypothetical protein